jgi:hypothetical protein
VTNRTIESLVCQTQLRLEFLIINKKTEVHKSDITTTDIKVPLSYFKLSSGEYVFVYEIVIKESGPH